VNEATRILAEAAEALSTALLKLQNIADLARPAAVLDAEGNEIHDGDWVILRNADFHQAHVLFDPGDQAIVWFEDGMWPCVASNCLLIPAPPTLVGRDAELWEPTRECRVPTKDDLAWLSCHGRVCNHEHEVSLGLFGGRRHILQPRFPAYATYDGRKWYVRWENPESIGKIYYVDGSDAPYPVLWHTGRQNLLCGAWHLITSSEAEAIVKPTPQTIAEDVRIEAVAENEMPRPKFRQIALDAMERAEAARKKYYREEAGGPQPGEFWCNQAGACAIIGREIITNPDHPANDDELCLNSLGNAAIVLGFTPAEIRERAMRKYGNPAEQH
jgi:hypothetical protein